MFQTTVKKLVTVREKGKIVRKEVPVVKTVKVLPRRETVYRTEVKYSKRVVSATVPLRTRTVRRLVPVVKKRVVTVNGTPRTLVTTQIVPTTETVVQTQTVTATQNVTQPPSTVTTSRTSTVTQTQTQTQTVTQTQTLTVTITLPGK